MFLESSCIYDLIYKDKNYKEEADKIKQFINKYNPQASSILDTACGTHEHVKYLNDTYQVDGIDLNEDFLSIAKQKNIPGQYFKGNIVNFNIYKRYDVILCLFSSIGYVKTKENLFKTLETFNKHLKKNGIIIIEPWLTPQQWKMGLTKMITFENKNLSVCRMDIAKGNKNNPFLEFNYLIGSNAECRYFKENHEMALFSKKEILSSFDNVGLKSIFFNGEPFKRGIYIGLSRQSSESR